VIVGLAVERNGTAIMAYAFLSGLVAMVAVVSFDATGTAVDGLYNDIATVFVASMPPSP
jgi:Flp pilus assembly pilin Flp